jgi:hypothetical protein
MIGFCAGFAAFGFDALVMIVAARMLLLRPAEMKRGGWLRSLLLGAMALGKTFLLIGASYAAIAWCQLPAMEFVWGAVFSLVLVLGGLIWGL